MKRCKTIFAVFFCLSFSFQLSAQVEEFKGPLKDAVKYDDTTALYEVIKGKDLNKCYGEYNVFTYAIRYGSFNVFTVLINKVDVNNSCNYKTPVFFVCKYGNLEMLKMLEQKGANINLKYNGDNLLQYAKYYGNKEIISYLETKFNTK